MFAHILINKKVINNINDNNILNPNILLNYNFKNDFYII